MRGYVVKPAPAEDFYVVWSDIVEAPVAFGPREYIASLDISDGQTIADRIGRADDKGSSALWPCRESPYLGWGDDTLIYQQQGILRRHNLPELCCRLSEDENASACDLLEGDDDFPVRHDGGCRCPATRTMKGDH